MSKDKNKFFEAVNRGNLSLVKALLFEDPKLAQTQDEQGVYAVFNAAASGHFEMVKYLIEYSFVSMNIWNLQHQSILHYGARGNNSECFAYLVDRVSLNPLEVNSKRETPLDIAICYKSENIIDYYYQVLGITSDRLYKNPIVKGAYPDPSIVRVESDYYMVHSSFTFFPCLPILHSRDLIHWNTIGHGITTNDYIDLSDLDDGRGFWAPDISYNKGKFYITATFRRNDGEKIPRSQMVISSEKPEGPYSKPTFIEEDGIDPSIFTDDDGRRYMLLNRGARIFEISEEGDKKLSEPVLLWYGANRRAPEAPHLLKKDNYYYLLVAEGGTGPNHQISVSRSTELMGVYESCPYNPILTQRDPGHPIQRSGHGKLVSTVDGEWYIVYLCSRMVEGKYSILGRETGLDKVEWSRDGWPVINGNRGPSGAALRPKDGENKLSHENPLFDWVFSRKPQRDFVKYNENTKSFSLIGGTFDLNHKKARNILVRRQQSLNCHFTGELSFSPDTADCEAGLTCYYDMTAHLKYFISKEEEGFKINITEQIGQEQKKTISRKIDYNRSIQLRINSESLKRSFWYRYDGTDPWEKLLELKNTFYLSDEGIPGKKFTGTMMGFFCLDRKGSDSVEASFTNLILEDMTINE